MSENLSRSSRLQFRFDFECIRCNEIHTRFYPNPTFQDFIAYNGSLCGYCILRSNDAPQNASGYEPLLQNILENTNTNANGAPPASKLVVKNLETVVIEKDEQEAITCTICQEIVNVGELARKLPCKHGYHDECITNWLKLRNSCPVCRLDLPTDDEDYENKRKRRKIV